MRDRQENEALDVTFYKTAKCTFGSKKIADPLLETLRPREQRKRGPHRVDDVGPCSGRKPPFWAVERRARPYKKAIQKRCTVGNAKST
jgi:hypothetical protein